MSELTDSPFDIREENIMAVATSSNPVDSVNGPGAETASRPKRAYKTKRVGADGRPMHRIVLVVSDVDKGHILTAITSRIGPLFVRAFGGDKISATGDPQEYQGRALAAICEDWQVGIEKEDRA